MEKNTPAKIFEQYDKGVQYKSAIGDKGLYEQTRINERFFVGDQWRGVGCDKPLVRHNVIKRIGEYKLSVIGSSDVAVNYSAEGVPCVLSRKGDIEEEREYIADGGQFPPDTAIPETQEINVVMSALSDYFRVTAERVQFGNLKNNLLLSAYQSGTGVLYTYWDPDISTGMYADLGRTSPIMGDIACEVVPIENVYFGDPHTDDVQKQPYIIISQKKTVRDLKKEAEKNRIPKEEIELIIPDEDQKIFADRQDNKTDESKATVLTKLWKEDNTVKAIRVTKSCVIRREWDLKLRMYPVAKFSWERRQGDIYGDSEITYLIPNQIAINRMLTASVWAIMLSGMPITLIDDERINVPVTNDPGQIIRVNGQNQDIASAIRYVSPPAFSAQIEAVLSSMIANTLQQSGANSAALGDIRPDNTSAIIAVREAATMPLQITLDRFYTFVEDVARIWADFWLNLYGKRALKVNDSNGTWYLPFDPDRYRNLLITAKVDVGASMLWSEAQSIQTLDNLFSRGVITAQQYLERLPAGVIPNMSGLLREMQSAAVEGSEEQQAADVVYGLSPEQQAKFEALPKEVQEQLLNQAMGGGANDGT